MHSDLQQLKREINQIVILVQVHSRSSFYGTIYYKRFKFYSNNEYKNIMFNYIYIYNILCMLWELNIIMISFSANVLEFLLYNFKNHAYFGHH